MPAAAFLLLLLLLAQAAGRQGWAGGLSCRLLLGPPADRGHNRSCLGKYAFEKASTRLNHGSAKYVTWYNIGRLLVDRANWRPVMPAVDGAACAHSTEGFRVQLGLLGYKTDK